MENVYLTATDIYKYFHCPHWPYYDRYATQEEQSYKRVKSEAEKQRQEDGVAHEERVVAELLKGQEVVDLSSRIELSSMDPIKAAEETLKLMQQGVAWIYQGTLLHGNHMGRPDLLERREGNSALGGWYYMPVDVKTSTSLQKYQKMQLAFYANMLSEMQGRMPEEAAILNIQGVCLPFVLADVQEEFKVVMHDLERVVIHAEKPELVLRKSCYDTGVWGRLCEKCAREANDIALLYKVDVNKLKALRSLGIRTIDDAAALDPKALAGTIKGLTPHSLEVILSQAQSLKETSVRIRKPIQLPRTATEIYFDIESYPPSDVDYLYGCLIRTSAVALNAIEEEYKPFVAHSLEDEKTMWQEFLAWIETLPPEYTVYHFSPYELTRLQVMERRYGGSEWLARFVANMVDLKDYSSSNITFPLYFYGLKYIAKFLGFSWRNDEIQNGGESVDQFERYLETRDNAVLDGIITYNEDDVRATAHLKDWMEKYASTENIYREPYPWS